MAPHLNILYVEDNDIVREVTAELLAHDSRTIVALGSAEEALAEFAQRRFDVVITDVSLPAMSGLDLVRSLLGLKPELPIIIASGYALEFAFGAAAKNVRTILKPFTVEQIEAYIADLLPRHPHLE